MYLAGPCHRQRVLPRRDRLAEREGRCLPGLVQRHGCRNPSVDFHIADAEICSIERNRTDRGADRDRDRAGAGKAQVRRIGIDGKIIGGRDNTGRQPTRVGLYSGACQSCTKGHRCNQYSVHQKTSFQK